MIVPIVAGVMLAIAGVTWGVAVVIVALISLAAAAADVFLPRNALTGRAYERYLEKMKNSVYQPTKPWVGYMFQGTMWSTILGAAAFWITQWVSA